LRLTTSVDTETVGVQQASVLERLVNDAGFFDLPERPPSGPASPDRFEYRVQIRSLMLGTHSIVVGEAAVPDRLRPLLDHLTALAMRGASPPDPSLESEE
jgi:hypothetical protein